MFISVNFGVFVDTFRKMGRENEFSYDALRALFDYLEEYEGDNKEQVELDVIALCCEFSEMELSEVKEQYDDWEEVIIATLPADMCLVREY